MGKPLMTWLLILITVVTGSCGDVLCAKGMASGGEISISGRTVLAKVVRSIITRRLVILGWVSDAISFFSLLGLLSISQLSIAVPATALSFVVDAIGARFILHEHLSWRRWAGVLLVTAGVVLTMQTAGPPASRRPGARVPSAVQTDQH